MPRKPKAPKPEKRDDPEAATAYQADLAQRGADLDRVLARLPRNQNKFGPKKSQLVMDIIADIVGLGYSRSFAAERVGIYYKTIGEWIKDDPKFAAQMKAAFDKGTEYYEDEARRRAVDGTLRPIFQGGVLVGHERQYSDNLMNLMLQGRAPDRYGKQRLEHTGKDGGPIQYDVDIEFVTPKGGK